MKKEGLVRPSFFMPLTGLKHPNARTMTTTKMTRS
jgi:hypothetical protein